MKAIIFTISIAIFLFSSCSKDDEIYSFEITGKLVSQISGAGISGGIISARVSEFKGSGDWAFPHEISSVELITDVNGNFKGIINYKDSDNVVSFEQISDVATGLITDVNNYYISEIQNNGSFDLFARKYEQLQITLKNTSPFNENDAVGIYIFQTNTNYNNNIIYKIDNFGDANEPYEYPVDDDGLQPYWVGSGVNAIIFGNVQEGASYQVLWSVRKNGISTEYRSETFDVISGEINTFEINY